MFRVLHLTKQGYVAPEFASRQEAIDYVHTQSVNATVQEFEPKVRCGMCGRELSDPISVARGIGPECLSKAKQSLEENIEAS